MSDQIPPEVALMLRKWVENHNHNIEKAAQWAARKKMAGRGCGVRYFRDLMTRVMAEAS